MSGPRATRPGDSSALPGDTGQQDQVVGVDRHMSSGISPRLYAGGFTEGQPVVFEDGSHCTVTGDSVECDEDVPVRWSDGLTAPVHYTTLRPASPDPSGITDKPTFWNDRVRRVEPTREGQPLHWIFGPCKADPNPAHKWCDDCYGVVSEEGGHRWCRACKASEAIANPAQQAIIDELVRATGTAVRQWQRHREHVACDECRNGGLPTFEQYVAKAVEEGLAGRSVVAEPVREELIGCHHPGWPDPLGFNWGDDPRENARRWYEENREKHPQIKVRRRIVSEWADWPVAGGGAHHE